MKLMKCDDVENHLKNKQKYMTSKIVDRMCPKRVIGNEKFYSVSDLAIVLNCNETINGMKSINTYITNE